MEEAVILSKGEGQVGDWRMQGAGGRTKEGRRVVEVGRRTAKTDMQTIRWKIISNGQKGVSRRAIGRAADSGGGPVGSRGRTL